MKAKIIVLNKQVVKMSNKMIQIRSYIINKIF